MQELWQLYDKQGRAIPNKGAAKDEVFSDGLLHGASHVWIYRFSDGIPEILLQKRAASKRTWPNRFDISAAGHIDLGESAITAAVRETQEEIGLTVKDDDLELISVQRAYLVAENDAIENEFQWVYLYELSASNKFSLQESEVASTIWQSLTDFEAATVTQPEPDAYVPHGVHYFATVARSIKTRILRNSV